MAQGKVKWFNDARGFGFIAPSSGDPDCFVHYSDIEMGGRKTLSDDEGVAFDVVSTPKGPKAVRVRPIEQPYRRVA